MLDRILNWPRHLGRSTTNKIRYDLTAHIRGVAAFRRNSFVDPAGQDQIVRDRHRRAELAHQRPLDEVEALLAGRNIQLAINVQSFSECTLDAVDWWTQKIAAYRVKYLFVVPNPGATAGARCQTFAVAMARRPAFSRPHQRPDAPGCCQFQRKPEHPRRTGLRSELLCGCDARQGPTA